MKEIRVYVTQDGKKPFTKWLMTLKDRVAATKIRFRLERLSVTGHYGDCKSLGQGIYELKVDFGPGYRIYFAEVKGILVLLGGDKGTQQRDIKKAKEYWEEFKVRKDGKEEN